MVLVNGDWNLDLFRLWLPEEVVRRIISIPLPLDQAGPNFLSWSRTTSGVFSVKSAYFLLKDEFWNPKEATWSMLWKIPGPQRVKHFIWLILKQRLLTNSERVMRGIAQDATCHLCGYIKEYTLHFLEIALLQGRFGKTSSLLISLGVSTLRIWKNRNLSIFQGHAMHPKDIVSVSYSWAKHFLFVHNDETTSQLNKGEWILGECSIATAELWGVLNGLLILQKQGYDEVIIQSDNLENVISINDSKMGDSQNSLIRRIQQILSFEEKWSLNYALRVTNQVADALAKRAPSSAESLNIIEDPPLEIKKILKNDNSFVNLFLTFSL
ncbi:uncharacterized protein [Gossypium hirsutum]|uniref:Uncharacterized protein n=1 Tax=Gossypium hirsutum TaxID=3635 RepID=A0ABM3BL90_GOSHI|nr:uncharacterized protein LOC121228877 [Gossypium hirsutum]